MSPHLSPMDFGVLLVYFAAVGVIGYVQRAREASTRGYLIGNRKIPWWAVLLSIIGTQTSALTFVGVPATAYEGNWTYVQLSLGTVVGCIVVSEFFVKAYYFYEVVSIYEFLLKRFGSWARNVGVVTFLVTRVLMSGVRLYAGVLVVKMAFALPTEWAVVIVATIAVLYTISGGIKAVIWTEVLQVGVMFGGALTALALILWNVPGGLAGVLQAASEGLPAGAGLLTDPQSHLQMLDFRIDPRLEFTVWSALIGGSIADTAIFGTDYDMVQRMLTAKDSRRSRLAVIGSAIADLPVKLLFLFIGTSLLAYYHFHPAANLPKAKEIFPYFILTALPPGLAGLVIAGVLSVVLSTFESALNALAGSFVVDIYRPYIAPDRTESHYVNATRWSTVLFCLAMVVVAFQSQHIDRILQFGLEVGTYSYGALLAIFSVGLFTRGGSDRACACSVPISILVVLLVKWKTDLTFPWFVSIGAATGFLASLALAQVPALQRRDDEGVYRVVT